MKTLTILFTLFLCITTTKAQFPVDPESGLVVYTDVVELPDMDKTAIFEKAKYWMVSTLKSGDNMIELDGLNSDKIVGAGNLLLDNLQLGVGKGINSELYSSAVVNFKFIVLVKDNKVKYIVKNFDLAFSSGSHSKVYSNLGNLEDCVKYGTIYYRSANINKIFAERNTPYIDGILNKMIKDFITSLKKKNEDNW
jgi:hypothetical protein